MLLTAQVSALDLLHLIDRDLVITVVNLPEEKPPVETPFNYGPLVVLCLRVTYAWLFRVPTLLFINNF